MSTLGEQERKKGKKKYWNSDIPSSSILASTYSVWRRLNVAAQYMYGRKNNKSNKKRKTTFKLHISYTLTMQAHF